MVRIIVDSASDINPAIADKFTVVPLTVRFGEEEYLDGVDITKDEFYKKLIEFDALPTTSQVTPDAFMKVFEEVKQAGDTAVVITLSSCLSGTYQSAVIAAEDYEGIIFPVDSRFASIGIGVLAERAFMLAGEGMDAESIALKIKEERENICLVAMLDTLEYLKKGGRISKTVAFAGGLLSIKPVINLQDGKVEMLGKARGSKQGNNQLIKEIEKAGGVDYSKPILLGYTGLDRMLLDKYIEDSAALWEGKVDKLNIAQIGSVIGTHAGPGAIGVAFFKK